MTSMELDDEEKFDFDVNVAPRPKFPYHLRFALTGPEFKRLGLDPMVAVKGARIHGEFVACIEDVSHQDGTAGESHRVEFQIENLEIECGDEEN